MAGGSIDTYKLDIDGRVFEMTEAGFIGVLFDIVGSLVFEKQAHRVSYVMEASETELSGSGGGGINALAISLYRHLKEQRCPGPTYTDLSGDTHSFRLHSIVDALVAVAFFLKAGDSVPHFIVASPEADLLTVLDRGRRSRLSVSDPSLRARLSRLVPGAHHG